MNCPHCATTTTRKRAKQTKRGGRTFFCPQCRCSFNERYFHSFQPSGVPDRYVYDLERQVIRGLLPHPSVLPVLALGLQHTAHWEERDQGSWLHQDA